MLSSTDLQVRSEDLSDYVAEASASMLTCTRTPLICVDNATQERHTTAREVRAYHATRRLNASIGPLGQANYLSIGGAMYDRHVSDSSVQDE